MSREKANLHDFLTEEGNAPREKKFYRVLPSPQKYSFVSSTTLPESRKSAIRFGIAMRPLKVSAMLHIRPRFAVAPRIATSA